MKLPTDLNVCKFCIKSIDIFLNYCDWNCLVASAQANGGVEVRPNDLPIACVKADGTMLEHEHSDHPDYKFPVIVEFVGKKPKLPKWDTSYSNETHALIYFDASIAITLYECTYSVWLLSTGALARASSKDSSKSWRLTDDSIAKIRDFKK